MILLSCSNARKDIMSSNKKEKITKKFFDDIGDEWLERTYDPLEKYQKFPSNKARMEVALGEISRLKLKGKMLDLGCGNGQLVVELLKRRNIVSGIDISDKMIGLAKKYLTKSKIGKNPDEVFRVMSLSDVPRDNVYDAVTALGFLEYQDGDQELFSLLRKIVRKNGYAFVGARNKLFNLFSLNNHTSSIKNELNILIKELANTEKYSRVTNDKIPHIQAKVSSEMNTFLYKAHKDKNWLSRNTPSYRKFPTKLVLRQHSPKDLEAVSKRFGFKMEYVVYYHPHPYPPVYEKAFPRIYNKTSSLMAPLGHTSIGGWMCSGFVAVLRKK